ncbi:murein L,D-transpeptidase [Photobacterium sp. TY1-4]|uniref:L,D-transpeptidase family protein n=1 Tax=Photobacterium sp. TY1-4 TaxID=2899122 RepID=UPI0021C205FA|nr:L,D-transpeptidase family protein [Photobacterium sp. TY1-4]UXI00003.1 L,D-transpeptidase family protein [Photobacterium sp. TY1-4]
MFEVSRTLYAALKFGVMSSISAAVAFSSGSVQAEARLGLAPLASYQAVSQQSLCPHRSEKVCFPELLEQVYAANHYYPIWMHQTLRDELFLQLKSLAYAELVPGLMLRIAELDQLKHEQDQRAFDILATDTFLVYKSAIQQVESKPSRLFVHQSFPLMAQTAETSTLTQLPLQLADELYQLRPQVKRLANAVVLAEKFRTLSPHELAFPGRGFIKEHQVIPNGHQLLDVLLQYGDISQLDYTLLEEQSTITNSGEVHHAVQAFQRRNGLVDDGIIGPATAHQLTLPYTEVARVIALNLQRSRFGSQGTDRPRIEVNIPDYMLRVTRDEQLLFESKVIVGRSSRPTYLFSSSLNTMVVNPYWNVPTTIKQEDVIPSVKVSPSYLAERNIRIVRSWRDRSEIAPEQIEWSTVDPETFPYEFQQGPGPRNALGRVKFLMPNDYSVFLHDTPARGLFQQHKRSFSSGCVRVEKADELAEFLLDYQARPGIPPYRTLVHDEAQDTISLAKRVDVDFTYVTAWLDEHQQLQMREDIYGYDRPGAKPVEPQYITLKDFSY